MGGRGGLDLVVVCLFLYGVCGRSMVSLGDLKLGYGVDRIVWDMGKG